MGARMKRFLVGCGVLMALFLLMVAGGIWWTSKVIKDVAGDLTGAFELSSKMPTDRMEQEAIALDPMTVGTRLAELVNQPVKFTGVVGDPTRHMPPSANYTPPPVQPGVAQPQIFVEPGIMVMQGPGAAFPVGNVEGRTVQVLGIMTRLTLGNTPGMTEEGRKQISQALGGSTDMPVVIARRVELVVGQK